MKNNQKIQAPVLIEDLGMIFPTVNSKRKYRYGLYKCGCGKEFKALTNNINCGTTISCGCYRMELKTTHGMSYHHIYSVWRDMITRCTNYKSKSFGDYGGRGIKVCDRWHDVKNFIQDMYPTFEEGLTIDRKDTSRDYEPSNCRWSDRNIQNRNTRVLNKRNTSGYRGVYFNKRNTKWVSSVGINSKVKYLGSFNTPLEAAMAYDKYVIENNLEHTINGVL